MVRAPSLKLRVESGTVEVHAHGVRSRHGAHALRLLDYFSTPHTLAEAMQALWQPNDGAVRWMQLSASVLALYGAGALVAHGANAASPPLTRGYAGASVHVRMLHDVGRTRAYLDAIAATVRPGDIVVDVGTGTGILAMAAARAGARHVYAIEASGIADTAQTLFEHNGFGDRITLVRGWSTNVTLPERADVMVAELVGMDPLGEQIAEITTDARNRLLTERPRLVPHGLRLLGLPVCVPDVHSERVRFTPASTARWGQLYGFDFTPLLQGVHVAPVNIGLKAPEAREVPAVATPIVIAEMDLTASVTGIVNCHAAATATTTGVVNGLLLYFDLLLAPGHTMTTAPDVADDTNHWGNQVVLLQEPFELRAGDRFSVHVERRHGSFTAWCEGSRR
jgi:hypothetical protein